MHRLTSALVVVLLLCPLISWAQEQPSAATSSMTEMPNLDANFIRNDFLAKIAILNRKVEKSTTLTLNPNRTTRYQSLAITALSCVRSNQGIRENDLLFIRVEDEGKQIFSGWISRKFPEVSLLQHPHYSILLLGC